MPRDSKLRLPQLDALRGLAALSVFWYHAFGMLREKPKILLFLLNTPLGAIFNGRSAVWLFFVLSGFVLNRKFVEMETYPRFWKTDFIVRRIFRIYPAFLATLILAFAFRAWVFNPTEAFAIYPAGVGQEWTTKYGLFDVLRVFTLICPGLKVEINPPIWSLVEEMRISLIFPLLIIAVNRWPRKFPNLLFLLITYAAGYLHPQTAMLRHLPIFVLGAICARHVTTLSDWIGRRNMVIRVLWFVGALCLYGISAEATGNLGSLSQSNQFLIEQVVGLGSAGLIIFCVAFASPTGWMCSKPMHFIGATSYSFYLSHAIFLYGLWFWIVKITGSNGVACLSVLVLSYAVSYFLFERVESPMNRIGHKALPWVLAHQPFRMLFPDAARARTPVVPKTMATVPVTEVASRTDNLP